MAAPKPKPRPSRSALVRRWAAVGAFVLVALLYYRPMKAYVDARGKLAERRAVVHRLEVEHDQLQHRLQASMSASTLAREARALGYVRPGERLYIVKGIPEWRKKLRASMMAGRAR